MKPVVQFFAFVTGGIAGIIGMRLVLNSIFGGI